MTRQDTKRPNSDCAQRRHESAGSRSTSSKSPPVPLLSATSCGAQILIRLTPPQKIAQHFPERLHDLIVTFHAAIGAHVLAAPSSDGLSHVALLGDGALLADLPRLEAKLARAFFRPLGNREAASFLGVEIPEINALHHRGEITALRRVPAFRFGRRFSYPVFSPEELIRVRIARCETAP